MGDYPKPPKRRIEMGLRLGADSEHDVIGTLRHILFVLESEGAVGRDITSGGPGSGFTLVCVENPTVTHESYFEDVERWLAERRKERGDQ